MVMPKNNTSKFRKTKKKTGGCTPSDGCNPREIAKELCEEISKTGGSIDFLKSFAKK